MERVQRIFGWSIAGFCLYLLVTNPFARASVGEPIWVGTDWITVSVALLTAATALKRFPGDHAIQILCFLAVGIGALANKNQTVGFIVLNFGFFLALFYGWYRTLPLPKIIATGILFFALVYAFDKATTNNNLKATFDWIILFVGNTLGFWVLYISKMKDLLLVARSYKNELDKKECSDAP